MLYILANPIGGDGNSVQIYQQVLKPLLLQHEIDHKFIKTQYHGHPKEIALGVDPAKCSCLVLISGDGMVHEVMQGYAQRCGNDPIVLRKLFESVPLALIPGGSSNGLSASFGSGYCHLLQRILGLLRLPVAYPRKENRVCRHC